MHVYKYLEIFGLFSLMVYSLYRSRCIDNDPEAWETGKYATSWIIPYSIMSVNTGVIADVMENHWGLTTWLTNNLGQSDIVGWELIYFAAGVPIALVAEKLATYLYLKYGKRANDSVTFEVKTSHNVLGKPRRAVTRIFGRKKRIVKHDSLPTNNVAAGVSQP